MYQALYRKYRPKTFEDVVGQEMIVQTLKNEIEHKKINHAYLFTGPRGTGKTSVAKLLAKILNCQNPNGILPCEKCVSCTQINNKQTTDIIEIDAASNNGVDEIREIRNKVNLVPSTSKYKVYIIDEVHMLTVGAFNALLKTLEEPPAHIIFILATTDPHKIPTTILSRCQRFDFKKISTKYSVERLRSICEKENVKVDEQCLEEIARLSDGGMRDALSMLDQVIAYSGDEITMEQIHEVNGTLSQKQLETFVRNVCNYNLLEVLTELDNYNNKGKNFVKVTEDIVLFLRNVLICKTVPNYFKEYVNSEIYENISREINENQLLMMIDLLQESFHKIKNTNNPKLMLELIFIKMMGIQSIENKVTKITEYPRKNEPIVEEKEKKSQKSNIQPLQVEEKKEKVISIERKNDDSNNSKISNYKVDQIKLNEWKERRVSNTLSNFNKKLLQELKEMMEDLQSLLINPDYSEYISLLLDGELKAVGNDYMIFVYNDMKLSQSFNYNVPIMEEIIASEFQENYRLVAVDSQEWEKIKIEFNQKRRKYDYKEEIISINDIFKEENKQTNEEDAMTNLFGNVVEYQ